jgi:alkylhydroperoxidase/carboxymuconolactone decarboxylase family protein YurZ
MGDIVNALTYLAQNGPTKKERLTAIESLAKYSGNPDAVHCLAYLASNAGTSEERIAAIKALG